MAFKIPAFIGICFLFFLAGTSFAGCSYDSFTQACNGCTFDQYGKMNEECWQGYQSSGTSCLGKQYTLMSAKYMIGGCPQVDECASKLTACKDANNPGSNLLECKNLASLNCFIMADDCVDVANEICANGKTEDEAGWNNVFTPQLLDNQTTANEAQNVTANATGSQTEAPEIRWQDVVEFFCPSYYGFVILFGMAALFYKRS